MLPSGNDAAVTLAEHFGHYLYEVATKYKNGNKIDKETTAQVSQPDKDNNGADNHHQNTSNNNQNARRMQSDQPMKYFLQEMNRYARAFGLDSTNYANPHGLSHKNNKSTAADIGKLACIVM